MSCHRDKYSTDIIGPTVIAKVNQWREIKPRTPKPTAIWCNWCLHWHINNDPQPRAQT